MVQAYNLSTQYVEAGGSEVQSQPGLHGLRAHDSVIETGTRMLQTITEV